MMNYLQVWKLFDELAGDPPKADDVLPLGTDELEQTAGGAQCPFIM